MIRSKLGIQRELVNCIQCSDIEGKNWQRPTKVLSMDKTDGQDRMENRSSVIHTHA